jgi:hypothetical protein
MDRARDVETNPPSRKKLIIIIIRGRRGRNRGRGRRRRRGYRLLVVALGLHTAQQLEQIKKNIENENEK